MTGGGHFDPTVALDALAVGAELADRYRILERLGAGGMGTVFRAHDRELDEDVALKVLRPDLAATPEALVRFRREVKLARRVAHPNVARTFDLGAHGALRFLTMELILGAPLSQRATRALPLPEALRVAAEVSAGLAAAHASGVVHRDLKPDNVMLSGERVVLTDFGIARLAEGQDVLATSGAAIGTPAYMAPEQLGSGAIDGRADVYALGVVLFELLTGELPFRGDSAYAMAAARLTSEPPNPRKLAPSLPDRVADLVLRALARRREERPDAQTFAERLAELRGERSRATPSGGSSLAPPALTLDLGRASGRTLRVAELEASLEHLAMAKELERAIGDAMANERGLELVTGAHSDMTLEGSVRVAGPRARVSLRLLDANGKALWTDRVDGAADDPFGLEDATVARLKSVASARLRRAYGPEDPEIAEAYDRARAKFASFDHASVVEAVQILEATHAKHPHDPWIASALARAILREAAQTSKPHEATTARAEELALRALDTDHRIGEAYLAIAMVRTVLTDFRAAVRATEEALARSPLLADGHMLLGKILCECGHTTEGLQRIDVALRLEPQMIIGLLERAMTLALLGDRERAEATLARAEAIAGPHSVVMGRQRLVVWFQDRAMAARAADVIESTPSNALWNRSLPMLRAYAAGTPLVEGMPEFFRWLTTVPTDGWQKITLVEVGIEYLAGVGLDDDAEGLLTKAAQLPGFIDLLWLDRCPPLAELRKRPSFAEARAVVAARVAAVLA